MLRLTKKADYGLMALKYLAEQADGIGAAWAGQKREGHRGGVPHSAAASGEDPADAGEGWAAGFACGDERRVCAGAAGEGDFGV